MLNYIYRYKKIYKNKEIRFYLLEYTFRKKNKTIVTVNSKEITENAGLLNCISWED